MAYPKNRKPGRPLKGRLERARELLNAKASVAVELVTQAATVAAKRGNHSAAAWMLEHMSETVDGKESRPIAGGIDRTVIESGSRAPTINIGWVAAPGALQAPTVQVVDVTPVEPLALPEGDESS